MRKFALFLMLMMGVGFVACEPQGPEPTEPLYPSPEAVIVDDEACGENSITLLFDGSAAVKAGATTFTSALTPDDESEPITITREVTHQEACKHVYANLPTGVYTVSVFATYPDGTSSEPVFVKDAKGAVVLLKIEGATLAVKHAYSTSSSLAFTWSVSGFDDPASMPSSKGLLSKNIESSPRPSPLCLFLSAIFYLVLREYLLKFVLTAGV